MWQKISIGFNVVLALAVAYLFITLPRRDEKKEFSGADTVKVATAFSDTSETRPPVVAYVNGDSINGKYAFIVEKTAALEAGMKTADRKVRGEYEKRQREAEELMQYAQSKELPDDEKMVIQQRMSELEQEMAAIEEQETGALMKKEEELQKELQKRVNAFLTVFSKEKGIDYVINYQEGVQLVLYGNTAYDITGEVIAGLNEEYEKEKTEK
jgi:outer membrane protein